MNRFISYLKVILGIALTLNLSLSTALFADPPPLDQNCAGEPMEPEAYSYMMQLADDVADIYARVFQYPFEYCDEPPLGLDQSPVVGDVVSGFRALSNGDTEPLNFHVTRLVSLTIDDYLQHAVIDPDVVATWRESNITFSPVQGWLTGPAGAVHIAGFLSAGLYDQGIMRALLIPLHLLPTAGYGADPFGGSNPSSGGISASDCVQRAYEAYNDEVLVATVATASCLALVIPAAQAAFKLCIAAIGWWNPFGLGICIGAGLAAMGLMTAICLTVDDAMMRIANANLQEALAKCKPDPTTTTTTEPLQPPTSRHPTVVVSM